MPHIKISLVIWSVIAVLNSFLYISAYGQMFSVESRGIQDRGIPQRKAFIGISTATFNFTGNENNRNIADRFNFDAQLINLRYEINTVGMYLNFGNDLTGIDSVSYFNFGLDFFQPLTITNTEKLQLTSPVHFNGSFTTVGNRNVTEGVGQFQQSSLETGIGMILSYRFTPVLRVTAQAVPNIGFTFSAGNTFFGATYGGTSGARLYFDGLFGDTGLSLGYLFQFRRFKVDEDLFDYDLTSNSFSVGLTF